MRTRGVRQKLARPFFFFLSFFLFFPLHFALETWISYLLIISMSFEVVKKARYVYMYGVGRELINYLKYPIYLFIIPFFPQV